MKKILSNNIMHYLIIVIVALVMCIPLFQPGIHTGDDGDFHISRTIGTIEQILNGNSPFIVERFSRDFGFAWNLFYPPISTIINVVFAFLTNNVVTAMKIFIFLTFVLSGITMYQLVRTISNNKFASLIASILYMCAPYRMLNAYTRLAVGELAGFIFTPIVLRGVYLLFDGKTEKSYIYVFGTIGLVLSHNISTLVTFFIGLFYVFTNIRKLKDKKIFKSLIISTLIIILSVLFFYGPLVEQMSSTSFELSRKMNPDSLVQNNALNPLELIFSHVNGISEEGRFYNIGVLILFGLIITPFVYKKAKEVPTYKFMFISGIVCCIFATFIIPWYYMPDQLQMIQFPWRMLGFIIFFFSIIAGINISLLINSLMEEWQEKSKIIGKVVITIVLVAFSGFYALNFISDLDYPVKDNSYYQEPEIIDYTWQVSRYSSYLEYWPQKAIDNFDYTLNRNNNVAITSGNVSISNENKINGILDFDITDVQENTIIELPYLYYKGYVVTFTPANSNEKINLDVTESNNGFIQVSLDSSMNGHINVEYHATTLHKICIVISSLTIVCYIIYLIIMHFKNRKKLLSNGCQPGRRFLTQKRNLNNCNIIL